MVLVPKVFKRRSIGLRAYGISADLSKYVEPGLWVRIPLKVHAISQDKNSEGSLPNETESKEDAEKRDRKEKKMARKWSEVRKKYRVDSLGKEDESSKEKDLMDL
ncbi:Protein of unknown function [Gryllus bimaculatus]|nr:Protein of unknown function [Gryllus bimaculatus]